MAREKRINIALTEELHRRLKIACALKNISIKNYIKASLAEAARADRKLLEELSSEKS